jgi:hypothetical protein
MLLVMYCTLMQHAPCSQMLRTPTLLLLLLEWRAPVQAYLMLMNASLQAAQQQQEAHLCLESHQRRLSKLRQAKV